MPGIIGHVPQGGPFSGTSKPARAATIAIPPHSFAAGTEEYAVELPADVFESWRLVTEALGQHFPAAMSNAQAIGRAMHQAVAL